MYQPVTTLALSAVFVLSSLRGIGECGRNIVLDRLLLAVIIGVSIGAAILRIRFVKRTAPMMAARNQLPFLLLAVGVAVVGIRVGELIYVPPTSLAELISFGC